MKIKKVRCKRDYRFLKPGEVGLAANIVKGSLYKHPDKFPDPGITEEEYAGEIKEYSKTFSAYKGHTQPMAVLNKSLRKLLDKMDLLADYVDVVAENDPITIGLAGFKPTLDYVGKKNGPGQAVVKVKHGNLRELLTNCAKVIEADYYGAVITDKPLPEGTWMIRGKLVINTSLEVLQGTTFIFDFNKARKKSFPNLEIGTVYYIYYWAGNASGIGPLSLVVSKKVVER